MTGYQAIYKCRLCGEIYLGSFTEKEGLAIGNITCACLGIPSTIPLSPRILEVHDCKNGDLGIGDF